MVRLHHWKHTSVLGHREIKLELTWNLPPCLLTFIVLGHATQSIVGEKKPMASLKPRPYDIISVCHLNFFHNQKWNEGYECYHLLLDWIWGLYHREDFNPSTINLVHILRLWRSHALNKNLLLRTYSGCGSVQRACRGLSKTEFKYWEMRGH